MRHAKTIERWLAAMAVLLPGCAWGQTHVVHNPDTVVRAVGVYEWTGDEGKATASRLVPITVFINSRLEDAGVYLARPTPFALERGTLFEVRKAGNPEGTLELAYARHRVTSGGGAFDDGWLAVGAFKAKAAPAEAKALKESKVATLVVGGGTGPHFGSKPEPAAEKPEAAKPVDRSTAAGAGTTVSAAADADQPTLKRPGDASGTDEKDDVDRPTLKKRSTPEQTRAQTRAKNQASVTGPGGSLNDDPDRPTLHRGKPTVRMEESDLPPLAGIPAGMHQRVAVSDAKDRPEHDFSRPWDNDAEHADVLAKMQEVGRGELARYGFAFVDPPAVAASAKLHAKSRVGTTVASKPAALTDEALNGYTLSYGGAATYVYEAQSPGAGGVPRYVTVVAQRDPLGTLKVAMVQVTDAAHLDRAPWYRLVDVVDAEASNRASLLFELRGQTTRQFALYRVIGAQAEQTFLTASAQ